MNYFKIQSILSINNKCYDVFENIYVYDSNHVITCLPNISDLIIKQKLKYLLKSTRKSDSY
jgi:hypothetical protein